MTITGTKKYILFGLAVCLLILSINFIGFETTVYLESALKGTCETIADKDLQDCSQCNCNKHSIECTFECKEEECEEEVAKTRTLHPPPHLSSRSLSPFFTWHTTYECIRTPDYSDICIYEQLCFDGQNLIFLSPEVKQPMQLKEAANNVNWDPRYRFPKPFPPSERPYIPIGANSFHQNLYLYPSSQLNEKNAMIFEGGAMWISKPELDVLNPFFFAKDTFNLFEAMLINETNPSLFPPMDYLAILRKDIPPGWASELLPALTQSHTKVVVNNFFSDLSISPSYLMCFPQAVVVGDKPRLFSGPYNAQRFREKLYSVLDVPPPVVKGFGKTDLTYRPRVVVTKRADNNPRAFFNLAELKALLTHYDLDFTVLEPFKAGTSLKSQIEVIREADVYIIVHGGGVINSLFLPVHTSLIEIFPFGMKNKVYEYSSFSTGVHYQAVRSWVKAPPTSTKEIHKRQFFEDCQNTTSLEHNDMYCVHWVKNAPTYIPMREMEAALIEAFDTQGYLLPLRASSSYFSLHSSDIPLNDWHNEANWFVSD